MRKALNEFLNSPEDFHNFWTGLYMGLADDTSMKDLREISKWVRKNRNIIDGKVKYHYLSFGYIIGFSFDWSKKNYGKVSIAGLVGRYLPELLDKFI